MEINIWFELILNTFLSFNRIIKTILMRMITMRISKLQ